MSIPRDINVIIDCLNDSTDTRVNFESLSVDEIFEISIQLIKDMKVRHSAGTLSNDMQTNVNKLYLRVKANLIKTNNTGQQNHNKAISLLFKLLDNREMDRLERHCFKLSINSSVDLVADVKNALTEENNWSTLIALINPNRYLSFEFYDFIITSGIINTVQRFKDILATINPSKRFASLSSLVDGVYRPSARIENTTETLTTLFNSTTYTPLALRSNYIDKIMVGGDMPEWEQIKFHAEKDLNNRTTTALAIMYIKGIPEHATAKDRIEEFKRIYTEIRNHQPSIWSLPFFKQQDPEAVIRRILATTEAGSAPVTVTAMIRAIH